MTKHSKIEPQVTFDVARLQFHRETIPDNTPSHLAHVEREKLDTHFNAVRNSIQFGCTQGQTSNPFLLRNLQQCHLNGKLQDCTCDILMLRETL
jgi:hypothetical protein